MKGHSYQFWCHSPRQTAMLCGKLFPEGKAHVLSQAEAIYHNTFLFQEHWEMERTSEPVVFEKEINWELIPKEDPEWLYAMNRHTFLLNLSKAWLYTKDQKYRDKAVSLWEDWMEKTSLTEESSKGTWRSLEAGLRCENWLRSLELLEESEQLPEAFLEKVKCSLREHGEYLKTASGNFQRLSNWGVLQDHGLFLLGMYFKDDEYIKLATERLDKEIHMQVMRDGSHWEQSPMYHCEVLHCVLDTVLIAKKNKVELPKRLCDNARNMCYALADWIKPDGTLFCQSDSDKVDARDLMVQGALLFEDGRLKASAEAVLEENIWDFGEDVIQAYQEVQIEKRQSSDTILSDSGNYVLRSDDTKDAAYLHMHCGCIGSGHGHGDLLHIDVGIGGEDVLIDPGRYTYMDIPLRRELKEPAAHNTTRVDGKNFSICSDTWGYKKLAAPLKGEHTFTKEASYISGFHLGYSDMPDIVLTERRIVFIKPDLFLIFDQFYMRGQHLLEQNFHFNKGNLYSEGNTFCWQGERSSGRLVPLTEDIHSYVSSFPYSTQYNQLEESRAVTLTKGGTDFQSLITLLAVNGTTTVPDVTARLIPITMAISGKELTPAQAQAVEIVKDNKTYRVIMVFDEVVSKVDFFKAGDSEGYGKVLVFMPENKDGICLAW